MLAVAPLRNTRDEREGEKIESFSIGGGDDFLNFSGDNNLLESINFDDLFEGMEDEDHVLPDLEMDPEILAELSVSTGGEESELMNTTSGSCEKIDENSRTNKEEEEDKVSGSSCLINHSQGDESIEANPSANKGAGKGRKSSKNLQGKRKVKVDWTPELHRRFVQAVEQLGVDKAVPSRILEFMGIDCLTRHNIASHLQKYRSHRKHLLAREAEAASWSQRRQVYGSATTGGGCKREMIMSSPWLVPTIGFPHMAPIPPHFSRPLHVWGHPSMDQSLKHIWPKHLPPSSRSPPPPPPTWSLAAAPSPHLPPPPPPSESSFWQYSRHQHVPNSLIPGTPFFPPSLLAVPTRYPAPVLPVPGIPPHAMYEVDPTAAAAAPPAGQTSLLPPFDFHPSTESIDATIGDVLSKPWLPLPLGLKPPSTDSVVVELHRQGIEKIPPTCASAQPPN